MRCEDCGEDKPASSFNAESFSPTTCFRCRVQGVAFTNPIKSGQGVDQWRHTTIAEHNRTQIAEAMANGLERPEPKHTSSTAWSPSQSQVSKLAKAKVG